MPSLFDSIMPIHEKFIVNFAPRASVQMFQIGDVAPDFELPDSEGRMRRLSEFRGKPLLLVFTRIFTDKIFCPVCYPHLLALRNDYEKFQALGAEILLVNTTRVEMTKIIVQEQDFKFPVLSDAEWKVFQQYGLGAALGAPMPGQFLLDKQGVIRFQFVSGMELPSPFFRHPDNQDMLAMISQL